MSRRIGVKPLTLTVVLLILLAGTLAVRYSHKPAVCLDQARDAPPCAPAVDAPGEEFQSPRVEARTLRRRTKAPAPTKPKARPTVAIEGDTPFQRRLAAGSELRRLLGEFELTRRRVIQAPASDLGALPAGDIADLCVALRPIASDVEGLLHHLLRVEWKKLRSSYRREGQENTTERLTAAVPPAPGVSRVSRLYSLLKKLGNSPANIESLRLLPPPPDGDRLGRGLLVRVWVPRATFARDRLSSTEIQAGEWLVRHLSAVTGTTSSDGFDVLVTPTLGKGVLDYELRWPWAAGLYHPVDRFCAVKSRFHPAVRAQILKHELVHAFCFELAPDFARDSLLCEGLAEYLERLRPGDAGLRLPVERFKHDFACLRQILDRLREQGVTGSLDPRKLLRLPVNDFYTLRRFSYFVAAAVMAYLGSEVIEAAFIARSDAPIVQGIERLDPNDFLLFLGQHSRDGDPRRSAPILDAGPTNGDISTREGSADERRGLEDILADLGIVLRPGAALDAGIFGYTPRDVSSDAAILEETLEAIGKDAGPILLLTDLSEAMRKPLSHPDSIQRDDFVIGLIQRLKELAPRKVPRLARLAATSADIAVIADISRAERSPYTAVSLVDEFDPRLLGISNLVLCTASRDSLAREVLGREKGLEPRNVPPDDLAIHYARMFQQRSFDPRSVLVVDLAGGESDALALARGIAACQSFRGQVAYWNPVRRE